MNDQGTRDYLADYRHRSTPEQDVLTQLGEEKKKCQQDNESEAANRFLIYEEVLQAQNLFETAFFQMKGGNYYSAWCTLERCQRRLEFLWKHLSDEQREKYGVTIIERLLMQYQSIYPYKLFLSPELLEKRRRCNICGQVFSIRNHCGHEPGKIYSGEICTPVVEDFEPLGVAFVTKPVQKYSVAFLSDPETGKQTDHYSYKLVEYLMARLENPYDDWKPEWSTPKYPQSRYTGLSRNDRCPCGSGKKYKKCCLDKEYVEIKHVEFVLDKTPSDPSLLGNGPVVTV